jgi:hypothetical protein
MSTLVQFQDRIRSRLAVNASDSFLTAARITEAVNQALKQIALEHDWPWLSTSTTLTTVAEQAAYPVPADFLRSKSLRRTDTGAALAARNTQEIEGWIGLGEPRVYAIEGNEILLAYIPSGPFSLTHRYIRQENTLAASSDTPLIPTYWDEGVIEYAVYLLGRALNLPEQADGARKAYLDWLFRGRDNSRQVKAPGRVNVRPGGWF